MRRIAKQPEAQALRPPRLLRGERMRLLDRPAAPADGRALRCHRPLAHPHALRRPGQDRQARRHQARQEPPLQRPRRRPRPRLASTRPSATSAAPAPMPSMTCAAPRPACSPCCAASATATTARPTGPRAHQQLPARPQAPRRRPQPRARGQHHHHRLPRRAHRPAREPKCSNCSTTGSANRWSKP